VVESLTVNAYNESPGFAQSRAVSVRVAFLARRAGELTDAPTGRPDENWL